MAISSEENRDAPIEIVDYDLTWPEKFETERQLLEEALSPWLVGPVEHVGSTAVVGLMAKPIIDIMAPVVDLASSKGAIPAAEALQYNYWPYKKQVMHWFCKPSPAYRTHHLHIVPLGAELWKDRLYFRDALRADARLAYEYAALKQECARQFRHDREAYTEAKGTFIQRVLSSRGQAKCGR